ncbi:hypothetical protein GW17_00030225 [Ensete ventricosum]|nr:hypothetical protein GW17_00030225 [Ensete ventricosum]
MGRADGSGAAEGWPQKKRGRADLARKIDGRDKAGNSAVGRGRGRRLLRLPGLQGQMRAKSFCWVGNTTASFIQIYYHLFKIDVHSSRSVSLQELDLAGA